MIETATRPVPPTTAACADAGARFAARIGEGGSREPQAELVLPRLLGLVDSQVGIVRLVDRERDHFPDEASCITYRAELAASGGLSDGGYARTAAEGGRALTHGKAAIAAVFEAYERYCLALYRTADLRWAGYGELTASGERAIDPARFTGAGQSADAYDALRRQPMRWTPVHSARTDSRVWIPAQLVYVPYRFGDGEPVLRDPITTGAASGLNREAAVLRGLMEVVERDAIMLLHYRRRQAHRFDGFDLRDPELDGMLRELRDHRLRVSLFQLESGIRAQVALARIEDPEGIAPVQTFGSKCSADLAAAARGALLEAAAMRRALRLRRERVRRIAEHYLLDLSTVDCIDARSHVWAQPEMRSSLGHLDAEHAFPDRPAPRWEGVEPFVADVLRAGGDILVADVTTPDVASLGISVVKTVVPDLQPMHLDEGAATWTRRLLQYDVPPSGSTLKVGDLNPLPHPFA